MHDEPASGVAGPIRVLADLYERASGIPAVLAAGGLDVRIVRLAAGDYAVGAGALVERKSVPDLHGSILNGRFWPQLGRLRSESTRPYLLVEGPDIDEGPLHPNAIRGACVAALELGIGLLRTSDPVDSARWLHRLAARRQRAGVDRDRPGYAQRPKAAPGAAAAEAMLAAVPGISSASARVLLRRFGTVRSVLDATSEEIRAVPGIGPERARALEETLSAQAEIAQR